MKFKLQHVLLLSLAICACPVKGQTLVSEWQFESNLVDSVSGYNGTFLPQVSYVPGESGQAWDFNGGIVEIPDSPSLRPPSVITVQAWVMATNSPGDYKYIICKSDHALFGSYAFETGGGGGIEFWAYTANSDLQVSPAAPLASVWDGNWHRVTGVYDGTDVRLYLDGTQVGGGTPASGAIDYAAPQPLVFGDGAVSRGYPYDGSLDEVKVFSVAMTSSQVSANYSNSNDPSATNGLVSWWHADGNANDSWGTNNGSVISTTMGYAPGESGTALVLQGGVVTVPNEANLNPAEITVQAWVNSAFPSIYKYMICQVGGHAGTSYALYTGGKNEVNGPGKYGAAFFITTADGKGWISPQADADQVWDGAWHQLTGTFDGTNVSLYVDGLQIGSSVVTNEISGIDYSSPGDLCFGSYVPSGGLNYLGFMDDVKIYNGAMTPAQVLASYDANLVSWWPVTGTNASDSVGNNNGVLSGAANYGLGRLNGLAFETSGGSVQIPDSSSLQIPSDLTLEAQVAASNPGANKAIITKSATPTAASYGFTTGPSGGLEFFVNTSGTEVTSPDAGTSLWDGNFHIIDGTYDGTKAHLYVDGVEAGSGTAASGSIQYAETQNSGALIFGDDATSVSSANFPGAITQVKVFNVALTSYEVGLDVPHNAVVLVQPQSQNVAAGHNVTFSTYVQSYPSYSTYQWQLDGTNIPSANGLLTGSTNVTLQVTAQPSTAGTYTLIETNELLGYVPGEVGQAFDFTEGGVVRASDANDTYDLQTFTYQAWVRTTNVGNGRYIIAKSLQPNFGVVGFASSAILANSAGPYFYVELLNPVTLSDVLVETTATTNIWDGNWHQITGTWDGNNLNFYVDGQQIGTTLSSGGGLPVDYETNYLDGDLLIGDISAPPDVSYLFPSHFNGQIDEVKVFNIPMSSTAVTSTFNDPAGTSDPYDATNGLVSWWKGEGNTVDSWSSNSTVALMPPGVVSSEAATLTVISSAPTTISAVSFNSGTFQATVSGPTGTSYAIQRTYSLTGSVVWTPVTTNTVPFTFTDTTGANQAAFYRAVSQ